MKTIKIQLDVKKVTESNLAASKCFNNAYLGYKRLQAFMKSSVLILFLCISISVSVIAQEYLGKSYNTILSEQGGPNDDGTTKEGLFYVYYYSGSEGLHIYYFKNNICIQEQIISSYHRYDKYKNKFAGLEKKYDIVVEKHKDKFTITIKSL